MNLFRSSAILCLFAAFFALGFAVQHAGLHAPMYYDSAGNIQENREVFASEGLRGVMHLFPQRPLPIATFYLNFLVSDVDPFPFRVFNLALLAGSSLLVVVLIRLIFDLPVVQKSASPGSVDLVAICFGLIFLVHPLQTYVTLYIWQRTALMACLFSYACLAVYLAIRSGKWPHLWAGYALCVVLFVCAVLSKENSITLPLILVMAEIAFFPQSWTAVARRSCIFAFIALGVAGAASFIQHPHGNAQLGSGIFTTIASYYAESGLTLKQVIFTQCRVFFSYLSLVLFPVPSRVQLISPQAVSVSVMEPPVTAAALTGVIALVAVGLFLLKRRPVWGFGILFFLTNLLPEGLLVPQYAFFGYRPVLPMFGVLLVLADCMVMLLDAAGQNPRRRLIRAGGLAFLAGVVILLGTSTALRADVWSDPIRFWKETVEQFPQDQERMERRVAAQALGNLGAALYAGGRYAEAVDNYEKAMELSPEDPRKMVSLAAVYAELGSFEEAEELLTRAIAIVPGFAQAYKNLGIVFMKQNKLDVALVTLSKGLERAPGNASFHEAISQVQLMRKDIPAAVASLRRAIALNPQSPTLYYQLGQALLAEGNFASAQDALRSAVQLKSDYWEAYNSLGIIYASQGKPAEALLQFRKALTIDPRNAQLRANVEIAMKQIQGRSDASGQPQAP
jgi:protein O-mannosyl-transferase